MEETSITKLKPGGSNSYLLKGSTGYLLVDAGMKGSALKIKHQLKSLGIKPREITHILITHDHYDHTGGLEELKEMTDARVIIHANELRDNSRNKNHSNLFFRIIVKIFGAITPEGKAERKLDVDIIIKEDLDLHDMGFSARVAVTPGHSPGSLCIITDEKECIAGDTLFNIFPKSFYPIIVFDRVKLADSYRMLSKENCKIYYPGHGEPITKEKFQKRILNKNKYMKH